MDKFVTKTGKSVVKPSTSTIDQKDDTCSGSDRSLTPEYKRIRRGDGKQKKHRKQLFSKSWEQNPKFSKWLRPDEKSNTSAKCIICNTVLATEISSINRHLNSK